MPKNSGLSANGRQDDVERQRSELLLRKKRGKIGAKARLRQKHRDFQLGFARVAADKLCEEGSSADVSTINDEDLDAHFNFNSSLLSSLLESARETEKKGSRVSPRQRAQVRESEFAKFKNVLAHPRFKASPMDTIAQHVANSVQQEQQSKLARDELFEAKEGPSKPRGKQPKPTAKQPQVPAKRKPVAGAHPRRTQRSSIQQPRRRS